MKKTLILLATSLGLSYLGGLAYLIAFAFAMTQHYFTFLFGCVAVIIIHLASFGFGIAFIIRALWGKMK